MHWWRKANLELIVWRANVAMVDAMAPVIELLDADR